MTKKKNILIIEDDGNLRDLYQEVLSVAGYEVEMASEGQEGLSKLQQGGHDLVLLDMMLPKMNGIDILKALKTHPVAKGQAANGRIVLMTNLSEDALIKQAEELGSDTHIIKSEITPSILLERIESLL